MQFAYDYKHICRNDRYVDIFTFYHRKNKQFTFMKLLEIRSDSKFKHSHPVVLCLERITKSTASKNIENSVSRTLPKVQTIPWKK